MSAIILVRIYVRSSAGGHEQANCPWLEIAGPEELIDDLFNHKCAISSTSTMPVKAHQQVFINAKEAERILDFFCLNYFHTMSLNLQN